MFRFLFGVFTGLSIGFAGGFVAGRWLRIRADRDVEEMMREPLNTSTTESSGSLGSTTSESSTAPAAATTSARLFRFLLGLACGMAVVTYYWWRSDQQQAEALEGWEWTQKAS